MRERERETPKTNVTTTQYLQVGDTEESEQIRTYNSYQNVVPVSFTETNSKDIQTQNISSLNDCIANVVGETSIESTAG
jgi:protein subunit release factor A